MTRKEAIEKLSEEMLLRLGRETANWFDMAVEKQMALSQAEAKLKEAEREVEKQREEIGILKGGVLALEKKAAQARADALESAKMRYTNEEAEFWKHRADKAEAKLKEAQKDRDRWYAAAQSMANSDGWIAEHEANLEYDEKTDRYKFKEKKP